MTDRFLLDNNDVNINDVNLFVDKDELGSIAKLDGAVWINLNESEHFRYLADSYQAPYTNFNPVLRPIIHLKT